ncbi:hypothetical protein F5Y17DRAFT_454527 [Xylariaceae sp. FL0594]|nr:hypothetical protein F5Y17DRAFT_454527 [Xylariaceae sp. FL0594]
MDIHVDCGICKRTIAQHDSALRVLGELPFDTVTSVLKHQWDKDVRRIVFAHAEHYHDQTLFDLSPSHKQQLKYVEADLKRHRSKYIMHYLHAIVEVHRENEIGATRVTMQDEIVIRVKLEEALSYNIPKDLDAVFRNEKPFEWVGALTWEQSKQRREEMECGIDQLASQPFGNGNGPEVVDRRLLTVISMTVRLSGDVTENSAGFLLFIPKTPDPMWCWNQTTENIQLFHHMTKLDLL